MTTRKLRLFDPRVSVKAETGVRISRPTLAWIEEIRAWLLEQMWARPTLRPAQWDGKLSQDEALRLILHQFAEAYGVPLNTDEREEACEERS